MSDGVLISLDDGRALDPAVVGAKAAGLARAHRAGLPVLPGIVVPVGEEREAVAAGLAALAARGSGGARLAAIRQGVGPQLTRELGEAAARLGTRLVVRSSSPVEGEGVWSGAFASYAELSPTEVDRGVAGCWASVFTPDALARATATGHGPGQVPMAALVQPEICPRYGGVAVVGRDGSVEVVGVAGSPAALVSGWQRGRRARVDSDGRVTGPGASVLDPELLQAVARLGRDALQATGGTTIEWAADGDGLWLLQVLSGVERTRLEEPPPPAVAIDPRLAGLVRLLLDHPGPLGEDLVLPWAVGGPGLPAPRAPEEVADPSAILTEARLLAGALAAARWGAPPEEARSRAGGLFRALRGPEPLGAFEVIARLTQVGSGDAARLLGLLQTLEQRLAQEGLLPRASWLRHLEIAEVELLAGGSRACLAPERRLGRGRWEPFLVSAVAALGVPLEGDPVVAGTGAGRVRVLRSAVDAEAVQPREVLVAVHPLNNFAPLLWESAAVITLAGSPGAHLFEVAASLGVPTVCNLRFDDGLEAMAGRGKLPAIASVDGSSGQVHMVWT